MSDLIFESLRQIDNLNSLEGTSLDAHTATNTKCLRNEADFCGLGYLNTDLTSLIDWACFGTLECTFFGFTLIRIDNSYSQFICVHV